VADGLEVHVEGLEGVEAALETMKAKVAKTAVRRALRSAGGILQEAIVTGAPKDSGFLSEHFKIATRATDYGMQMSVGATTEEYIDQGNRKWKRTAADVAFFNEYGTMKDPAKPFMRPALDQNADAIVEEFISELNEQIESAGK
jgi:HK97 gp10 family phage protein